MLILAPLLGLGSPAAVHAAALRTVSYRGFSVRIPHSWPVYRLSAASARCVRFDRHALYLGVPSRHQACPAGAAGRTEAILIEPSSAAAQLDAGRIARAGSAVSFEARPAGLIVTATWGRTRWLISQALGRAALTPRRQALAPPRIAHRQRILRGLERPVSATQSTTPSYYTGSGFDACSAPSSHAMSAWSTTYHAIGVYIGGVNEACSQPNLTPDWVSQQIAAGWHLIPTYVGLQAPSNGCGCAGITPSQAAAQGTAAATDAAAQMQSLGLPAGNPVYFDMEGYSRTQANTSAVLSFLGAWTSQLHADGYLSGVYSSVASGITDLAAQWGTSYPEPDDIWFADWNGQASTSSSAFPAADWSNHQRLHQYQGAHNETHGGVTINIDSDYLDGAAAGTVAAPAPVPPPTMSISPTATGSTTLRMSWPGGSGLTSWQLLGGPAPTSLTTLATVSASGGASTQLTFRGSEPYFQAEALGSGGQVLATSSPMPTPAHLVVFGHSAFVSLAGGTAGLPIGCYTGAACHLKTTVRSGRTTLAQTGSETIASGGTGLVYFTLNRAGRTRLEHSRTRTLPIKVSVTDSAGTSASAALNLVGFAASGRAPRRTSTPSSGLRVTGLTAFISPGGVGGVLTACLAVTPCSVSLQVSVPGSTVRTGHELIGANELGYVTFRLTGRALFLLEHAPGNQLGAKVTVRQGSSAASASIVLTRF